MILVVKSSGNDLIDKALQRVNEARKELHCALRELSNLCENFDVTFVQELEKKDAVSGN